MIFWYTHMYICIYRFMSTYDSITIDIYMGHMWVEPGRPILPVRHTWTWFVIRNLSMSNPFRASERKDMGGWIPQQNLSSYHWSWNWFHLGSLFCQQWYGNLHCVSQCLPTLDFVPCDAFFICFSFMFVTCKNRLMQQIPQRTRLAVLCVPSPDITRAGSKKCTVRHS